MAEDVWMAVHDYFAERLVGDDEGLAAALRRSEAHGLPDIAVAPNEGKLLMLLARMSGARRILEIGTLGGYSTIWLARALPEGGALVTLEREPRHAAVARENVAGAGLADRVEIRVGPAMESLDALAAEGTPFDFVFFDADKASLPGYFTCALALSRPGTVMVFDNVVRRGRIVDAATGDESVDGVRRLVDMLAAEPRVEATALQTVGAKGYDGFAIALVMG